MARDKAYYEAEKKIEKARRSGATKLDLRKIKLTELPETLRKLSQLQSLNISATQLTTLPEWLGQLTQLQTLYLNDNKLTELPETLGQLTWLQKLSLQGNKLTELPESLSQLRELRLLDVQLNLLVQLQESLFNLNKLQVLYIGSNRLKILPEWLGRLNKLQTLGISSSNITSLPQWILNLTLLENLWCRYNNLTALPDWINQITKLKALYIDQNKITDLPSSLTQLKLLNELYLDGNPLNHELAAAYKQGLRAVKAYLRAKAEAQIMLNEAKLILVGEGEVGKSCLLDALRGQPWQEHDTTHGIQIEPVQVTDTKTGKEITLNGWDFGGQRVYRPTHQLFFSSPAVYLVVWKPREGPQQGFVKEWIKLVKHREPEAKILVVATHGGPQQRQPDIDRQELWDLFGKDTVLDFFHIDSKPDKNGKRRGIEKLKEAIAGVAAGLPEMEREVPKSFQEVREALNKTGAAYLPLARVFEICRKHQMDDEVAKLFVTISHRLGHLIHYEHDPALRDIVILKPDWLATAISFVLDDEDTRKAHGLVPFSRLSQLWDDLTRAAEFRYPTDIHPIFLRLMERFDLSYRVAGLPQKDDANSDSLIAQLVPDNRPEKNLEKRWLPAVASGDTQQVQICRIVDDKGQTATAEGLFYQLIVRLHKYSLGRTNFEESIHWQRGLVLDDGYNGRALLEHTGNDIRITVRAPYPERFLAMLTGEVKYLVESFWEGLRCDVMVPCIEPCGKEEPGTGLFEVEKLINSKRKNRPEYPCPVCNEWQDIDCLLRNAPAAQPIAATALFAEFADVKRGLAVIYQKLQADHAEARGRFDQLNANDQRLLSRVDNTYVGLMQAFTDEAKEGPRLFSFVPVDQSNFNPKNWAKARFRLTLWCEHSRLPLPVLNNDSEKGVYIIELTREWFQKAGPYLKLLAGTLRLVLPVASSAVKLALDDSAYKEIEEQLDFGKKVVDVTIGKGTKIDEFLAPVDATTLEHGEAISAHGATLRELHTLLKKKDPGFGGLVRVMNKRQEFLWVHPQFEGEY